MALNDQEVQKINNLYTQLDAITIKYNKSLEDIHKLTNKISEYADALVTKCECKCHTPKKK